MIRNPLLAVNLVKTLVKRGNYHLTKHAIERMEERDISEAQIERCVVFGEIVSIQDHGRNLKLKFKSKETNVFVIVTAIYDSTNSMCAIVITCAHTLAQLEEDCRIIGLG